MMLNARVARDDYLYVCSGNIFHAFHSWLNENKYNWELSKIDGLAHERAEYLFTARLLLQASRIKFTWWIVITAIITGLWKNGYMLMNPACFVKRS